MNLLSYLEKEKIASREMLRIFAFSFLAYTIGLFFWKVGLIVMAYVFLLIALGGICNLYVISYNDCKMPVIAKNKSEFEEFKK